MVRLIGLGFVLLSVLIVVGSSWDVTHSFYRQREQEIQTKTRQIDLPKLPLMSGPEKPLLSMSEPIGA